MNIKMSKRLRLTIVKGVVNDIPTKDYTTEAHKVVVEYFESLMPTHLTAVVNDPKLQHVLQKDYVGWLPNYSAKLDDRDGFYEVSNNGKSLRVYNPIKGLEFKDRETNPVKIPKRILNKFDKLIQADKEQATHICEAANKLLGALCAYNSVNKMLEDFPELKKYVPIPEPVSKANLPIDTSVMKDLHNLGYPKKGIA